jgi:hypothetical protein
VCHLNVLLDQSGIGGRWRGVGKKMVVCDGTLATLSWAIWLSPMRPKSLSRCIMLIATVPRTVLYLATLLISSLGYLGTLGTLSTRVPSQSRSTVGTSLDT